MYGFRGGRPQAAGLNLPTKAGILSLDCIDSKPKRSVSGGTT